MKTIYHILNKCLFCIVALQLLNLSFHNPDTFFSDNTSAPAYCDNRIDSAYEYVTEEILGWDNYVPENRSGTDHRANHIHKTGNISIYVSDYGIELPGNIGKQSVFFPVTVSGIRKGFEMEVNPPPPKAC